MKAHRIQVGITVVAILVAVAHHVFPAWALDEWTMYCLVIAVLPWLAPLFKSLELPGVRLEFQDLERAEQQADKAGLLSQPVAGPEFFFQVVADHDPNLALAGLRIEIERRLIQIAEQNGVGTRNVGIGRLLNYLSDKNVLSQEERSVLADMTTMLNKAVHGAEVDHRAAEWAIEVGPQLLSALDKRIAPTHQDAK